MMIEDDELRDLYKTSSQEHLQKLETDLMQLEKNPQDSEAIEEFLREAHTLKGDSRMLGLNEIEMLVHQLEDCVEKIHKGEEVITGELCDRLYQGIDAVNQLAQEAITGEASNVNAFQVLAMLMGAESDSSSSESSSDDLFGKEEDDLFPSDIITESFLFEEEEDDLFPSESNLDSPLFEEEEGESSLVSPATESISDSIGTKSIPVKAATAVKDYQIDTIRVEPQKLDTLMTQASELTVTKLRISRQMAEIEQIVTLWSEWNKDNSKHLPIFERLESSLALEQLQPLRYFFDTTQQHLESFGDLIDSLKTRANEDIARLDIISERLESGIQGLRQLPLSTIFNLFPRMVRDIAKQQGKKIELIIEGGDTQADKKILEEIKDPLLHLIRNAIDHGIETAQERESQGKSVTATILLRGYQTGSSIGIEISDDGRGLNLEQIKQTALRRKIHTAEELEVMSEEAIQSLIFASGFSTRTEVTELSGRGVGLDVVRANVERLKGSIKVDSIPHQGCKFQVRLNTTLATTKVLIVEIGQTLYALPVEFIQTMVTIDRNEIFTIEGSQAINFEDRPISIAWLADLLEIPVNPESKLNKILYCIILRLGNEYFGAIVDSLVDQQDVVLKPQSKLLQRVPNMAGATILGDGEICMILNPPDLLHSLRQGSWHEVTPQSQTFTPKNKLLLVEDSIIIRTQMIRLLKNAGYDVTPAVDGLDGYKKLQQDNYSLVVSDVEMPNMTGLELTAKIRQHPEYQEIPIVLVTTLASPEDKRRGKEAGANAYLTKGDFDRQLLLNTLKTLVAQSI
ncbi:MAG: hybrid sensor histidine kinase/response regulator [Pleurocapsa sp.]